MYSYKIFIDIYKRETIASLKLPKMSKLLFDLEIPNLIKNTALLYILKLMSLKVAQFSQNSPKPT